MPSIRRAVVLAVVALLAASCSFDASRLDDLSCADEGAPCGGGRRCQGGLCLPLQCGASCYDADAATLGADRPCKAGVIDCSSSEPACVGQLLPASEACNRVDDDCDGEVDDEVAAQDCEAPAQLGVCAAGRTLCRDGVARCEPGVIAGERCDGLDNDCDGLTDDATAARCYEEGGGAECDVATGLCLGTCATGLRGCVGGAPAAACDGDVGPAAEAPDRCDGLDDDCDGVPDQDCPCTPDEVRPCFVGPAGVCDLGAGTCRGACTAGTQTCRADGAGFDGCTGSQGPRRETCSDLGTDDDCDGDAGDVEGAGEECVDEGAVGACRLGHLECEGGVGPALVCETAPPAADDARCNGLDDDCDGATDEEVDFDSPTDCGGCGVVCAAGTSCCAGVCSDPTVDEGNCGGCVGRGGTICGQGELCCGGACTNPAGDEASCGGCGIACPAGAACCGGVCSDPLTDAANCGGCAGEGAGQACGGAAGACCAGQCRAPTDPICGCPSGCPPGQECCSGACRDTAIDEGACGACDRACAAAQLCCGGACVDSGAERCGDCDVRCAADRPLCCEAGMGVACRAEDASNCGGCGVPCKAGLACCGGDQGCFDLGIDAANCGACGKACLAGESCCGGKCTSLAADEDNCGRCGRTCGLTQCKNGLCL